MEVWCLCPAEVVISGQRYQWGSRLIPQHQLVPIPGPEVRELCLK